MRMYEVVEHTADAGLRIEAPDLNGLFVDAAKGLYSLIIENPEDIRPLQEVEIHVDGSQTDYLLFDWLNELLYRFDSERLLLAEFSLDVDGRGLHVRARGETFDPARHRAAHEVKAITYHELCVQQVSGGWEARVIVDI